MDNLTATAIAAERSGMSYGKYVALHGIECSEIPTGSSAPTKICPECGSMFSMRGRKWNTTYCTPVCQMIHNRKEYLKRYHEKKKEVDHG